MSPHALHNLQRPSSNKRRKKRVGRGGGSGKGTYSGKGLKGQRARSGGRRGLARRAAFQQLLIRTPKLRGFKRASPEVAEVNLEALEAAFGAGQLVTPAVLIQKGLARKAKGGVKILGRGSVSKKLTVRAHAFSRSARLAIEAKGGTAEVIS
ncbi:MAG: 50S ribosomal protein L15 [Parcubacteria group bacterium]|nr:50S ribosomal protein L15 [Parcubacteria group bacterium]